MTHVCFAAALDRSLELSSDPEEPLELPPLDGVSGEDEETPLVEEQDSFAEDELEADLETGLGSEDEDDELLSAGEDEGSLTADSDEAGDQLDQLDPADGVDLTELEETADEQEGLDDSLETALDMEVLGADAETAFFEGYDEGLGEGEFDLPRLPPLSDSADDGEGLLDEPTDERAASAPLEPVLHGSALDGDRTQQEVQDAPPSVASQTYRGTLGGSRFVELASGDRLPVLPGVTKQIVGLSTSEGQPLCVAAGDSVLVYHGALHFLQDGGLRRGAGVGLVPEVTAILGSPFQPQMLWALSPAGVQLSQDGGRSFQPPLPGTFGANRAASAGALAMTSSGKIFVVENGELISCDAGGGRVREAEFPEPITALGGDGAERLALVTAAGVLYRSQDSGASFEKLPEHWPGAQDLQVAGDRILLRQAGQLRMRRDGESRTLFTAPTGPYRIALGFRSWVYACIAAGQQEAVLARVPLSGDGAAIVVTELPAALGNPLAVCVGRGAGMREVLVVMERGMAYVRVEDEPR